MRLRSLSLLTLVLGALEHHGLHRPGGAGLHRHQCDRRHERLGRGGLPHRTPLSSGDASMPSSRRVCRWHARRDSVVAALRKDHAGSFDNMQRMEYTDDRNASSGRGRPC